MVCFLIEVYVLCVFFKPKTSYEMRSSDGSSDVCASDLLKTDSLRALGGDVNSLERMARGDFGGGGSYGGRSDAIYQDMLERLGVSANGDQTDVRYQTARSIAMDKAMAEGMGEAATSRGEGLEELRNRLATA